MKKTSKFCTQFVLVLHPSAPSTSPALTPFLLPPILHSNRRNNNYIHQLLTLPINPQNPLLPPRKTRPLKNGNHLPLTAQFLVTAPNILPSIITEGTL